MRQIKFRGKPFEDVDFDEINVHISKDDFVYGNLIVDGKVAYIVNGIVEVTEEYLQLEQWIPVRPETVGQYTGLHDKNGVEICGGDRIRLDLNNEGYKDTVVVYRDDYMQFMFDHPKEVYTMTEYHFKPKDLEIIGNIHEEVK